MKSPSVYKLRGASTTKEDVYQAIENINYYYDNSTLFCNILPNNFVDYNYIIMHSDGVGTKASLAYIYWKETGDISVFKNLAIDSLVMNLDDILCVGAINSPILLSNIINRNKNIPKEVLKSIIDGFVDYIQLLNEYNIDISITGGETADLGDIVKTLTIDSTISCGINDIDLIDTSQISYGNIIIGFSSYGQSKLETEYNSGIGSNGLTAARHDCLDKSYAEKYPESYDINIPKQLCYNGIGLISNLVPNCPLPLGKALLSPTRTYMPVIKKCLTEIKNELGDYRLFINGMIHCTGGGQTKCLKYGKNIRYVKNDLFDIPPIFKFILKSTNIKNKIDLRDMFLIYNMGHRFEMIVSSEYPDLIKHIIEISKSFNIDAKIIGYCDESVNGNSLEIIGDEYHFFYK